MQTQIEFLPRTREIFAELAGGLGKRRDLSIQNTGRVDANFDRSSHRPLHARIEVKPRQALAVGGEQDRADGTWRGYVKYHVPQHS